MKLEPIRNVKKPKYAAIIAAAATAALLTGCQTAGDVAIPAGMEGQIEEVVGSEPLELAGDEAVETEETIRLQLDGKVALSEREHWEQDIPDETHNETTCGELGLDGDVEMIETEAPDGTDADSNE